MSIRQTLANLIKGNPTPASVYVVPEITDLVVGFMLTAEGFVHGEMFPHVAVDLQQGKYPVFNRGAFMRDGMKKRADGAASAGHGFDVSHQSFSCDVWSWHTMAGKQLLANGKRLDLERAMAQLCANAALINREVTWMADYFRSGVWSTEFNGFDTTPDEDDEVLTWMDDDADPIYQLETMIENGMTKGAAGPYKYNRLLFSQDLWTRFKNHPNVLARINQGQTPGGPAKVTREMVANWLEIEKVLVANAVYTTSKEGQTDTFDFIAPSGSLLLCHAASAPGWMVPSAGYEFDWTGYTGAGAQGQIMSSWWEQKESAQYFECEQAYDHGVVSADLATFAEGLLTPAA